MTTISIREMQFQATAAAGGNFAYIQYFYVFFNTN